MEKNTKKTILIAGSAGSGIKFVADTLIPSVFLYEGIETSSNITYGAAQRKGEVIGDIVIGGGSPHFYADIALALTQEGFDSIKERIKNDTPLLYDKDHVSVPQEFKNLTAIDCKESGQYNNVMLTGALLKYLGAKDEEKLKKVIAKKIKKDTDQNLALILKGFSQTHPKLEILTLEEKDGGTSYYMSGNEATVWGALMGGANFYAGYPITPSSEAMHEWGRVFNEFGGVFKQANSEEQAIGIILGAAARGMRAWTATSGPGLSRMLEQIGYAAASGIPFVIYNAQRVGPSTGLPTQTQQSDLVTAIKGGHGDYPIIVLAPHNAQESFELAKLSFKLAKRYSLGVIINSSKEVAQRRSTIKFDIKCYDDVDFGLKDSTIGGKTGLCNENGIPKRSAEDTKKWLDSIFRKFEENYDGLCMADFVNIEAKVGDCPYESRNLKEEEFEKKKFKKVKITKAPKKIYICYGENLPVIKELAENENAGIIGLRTIHPYPIHLIKQLNRLGVKKVVSVESNRGSKVHSEQGQLTPKIRQYFKGKVEVINSYDGQPLYTDKLGEK